MKPTFPFLPEFITLIGIGGRGPTCLESHQSNFLVAGHLFDNCCSLCNMREKIVAPLNDGIVHFIGAACCQFCSSTPFLLSPLYCHPPLSQQVFFFCCIEQPPPLSIGARGETRASADARTIVRLSNSLSRSHYQELNMVSWNEC